MTEHLRGSIEALVDAYCAHQDTTRTRVGAELFGDRTFISGLLSYRRSGSFNVATYDKVAQTFSDHWPSGLAWPRGVPRPAPRPVAAPAEAAADPHPIS